MLQVSSNGYVSFRNLLSVSVSLANLVNQQGNPVLAPFWSANDASEGTSFYGLRNDSASIDGALDLLRRGRPGNSMQNIVVGNFRPSQVLVATWTYIQSCPGGQEGVDSGRPFLGVSVL